MALPPGLSLLPDEVGLGCIGHRPGINAKPDPFRRQRAPFRGQEPRKVIVIAEKAQFLEPSRP